MMTRSEKERSEKERSGTLQRFLTNSAIRAAEGEGKERRFIISFSSEEPYNRWWGTEILSHEEGAVNLERINSIGCVLYNHNRDKVIGRVVRAWVENGRGNAEIEFDEDEASEIIFQKVKKGTLKGVSVGYIVDVWEEVAANKKSSDGRFTGPCDVATRWTPFEISIVSVPADSTVGVGRAQEVREEKGVGSFYFYEKQLQINNNLFKEEKKAWD